MKAQELLERFARGERDFSGANFAGDDLVGAALNGAKLVGADLPEVDLTDANLTDADLRGADLHGACLEGANLDRANLEGADLRGANLRSCNIDNAKLGSANLSQADLTRASLVLAKLKSATLKGADLSHADLTDADLSHSNLVGADLSSAFFRDANLTAADLRTANLTDATLALADLRGANLGTAFLQGTNFSGASLKGVSLNGAVLESTVLADVDLSDVSGLNEVSHHGPSALATNTLVASLGRIPKEFLRGCGLADWEIEYARLYGGDLSTNEATDILYRVHELRVTNPIQYYSVFISYAHADAEFARSLFDVLQDHGIRCWLDQKQLLPGDDIHDRIDHGIRVWDKVILCASQHSLTSWWVDNEIDKAFAKEQRLMKDRQRKVLVLVPLMLDEFLLSGWESGKASQVRSRMAGDFRGWQQPGFDMSKQLMPLMRALRADGGGREPPPPQRL